MWRIPYRQGTSYVDERYDQVLCDRRGRISMTPNPDD